MQPSSMATGSVEWYDNETIPFFRIDIQSEAVEEGQTVYERLYGTVFDGMLVTFDLYNGTEEISEEYDALMRQIVDSVALPKSAETTYTLPDVGMTLTLPEGVQILTPTTPADDPVWGTAKVLDTTEKITQMNEDGILAEIYAF